MRVRPTKKHVILFLAANPHDIGRLALDREARSIQLELKRSGYRDRFALVTRWAAEPLDLLRELREWKPTVVHFSGHGGGNLAGAADAAQGRDIVAPAPGGALSGLVFHSAAGGAQEVSPEAIAQAFGSVDAGVRLVVLNACFTEPVAEALLVHVDCVVGMTGATPDAAARSFSIGFYGGLGEQASVAAAFQQGQAAIHLDGFAHGERPQLKVRAGVDAARLILADAAPSVLAEVPCPYPGMRPYTVDDVGSFHGRDAEITEVVSHLRAGEREILLWLISFGEGCSDTCRQQSRSMRSKLCASAQQAGVLQRRDDDDDRGEPRVDLAHEVMIAAWPTLAGWIQRHRVDEQQRHQLESAATEWAKHGRGARGLLDPIELVDAESWLRTESARELGEGAEVTAFIAASRAAQTRQRRRRHLVVSAMGLWGLVAVVVAAGAATPRHQADDTYEQTVRVEASDRETRALVAGSPIHPAGELGAVERSSE